jgi:hypothetical protein
MGVLRVAPEDLAADCPFLHTLALGQSSVWDIDRRADGAVELERWSYARVKHRTASDFRWGGEDAEWLLQGITGELTGPDVLLAKD